MKITIQGQDYTSALDAGSPLTVERKLNEPSVCQLWLSLPSDGSLTIPSRNQALAVTGDDGIPYFTGYIAVRPLREYAGIAMEGPHYRIAIEAVSDEMLLDQLQMMPSTGAAHRSAGALMARLVERTGCAKLSTSGLSLDSMISNFVPPAGATWSMSAGQVANQARAAYQAINGALTLEPVPSAVHALNEADGSLDLASLAITARMKRMLANDVTVCGEHEPVAYVTEYFVGDGLTTQFNLAAEPFLSSPSKAKIIAELFNEPDIDVTAWSNSGGGGYLALGAGGLVMNGGNGIDGNTLLTWADTVEMGGTLLLEAAGVTLEPGSTGIVAAFYGGFETLRECEAGFQVNAQQGSGAVTLQPIIQGTPTGACYAITSGHQYTLRLRVSSPEIERVRAIYRSQGDSGSIALGGQDTLTNGKLHFEIQEYVDGVASMPVTLYDGAVTSLLPTCSVVAASGINLKGTMRALNLTNLGSGWVVSTPPNGNPYSRRIGSLTEAAECYLGSPGRLVFNTGFVPAAGEKIAVSYRTAGRAVGRAVDAESQGMLAQAGLPAVASWIGSVLQPPARSSADCRNAASAMVQASASESALWSGTYKSTSLSFTSDVWPGDALQLSAPSAEIDAQLIVRTVKLSYRASYPDVVGYVISFANDWAEDLAIKASPNVPVDAWLPVPVSPIYLENLAGLQVTALDGDTVTITTGVTPPSGGGFEVRRRDFAFMPGEDADLVMRGTQPNMTLSRESANDRFYIRMYDGATPPNYSEFSTALFINLPLERD